MHLCQRAPMRRCPKIKFIIYLTFDLETEFQTLEMPTEE
jgi:hypothetical protein